MKKVGWRDEGISWHSGGNIPIYRLYNPNAKSGTHHYTVLARERDHLKKVGWRYEGISFYASNPNDSEKIVQPRPVDVDITGIGGVEQKIPGSYRLLYSNKPFNQEVLPDIATIDFSADVALTSTTLDYETQFVIAGNGNGNGQVGVELHYQAGPESAFGQNRINTTTINFPSGSGITGQQFYSVNTTAPRVDKGQIVHLQVKYFDSGFMQAFVEGQLVGQFKTKLVAEKGAYILHDTTNRGTTFMKNILVLNNGIDITRKGVPSFSTNPLTITNESVSAAYFQQ